MIDVLELRPDELARVGDVLPLHRFTEWRDDSTYLVAWDRGEPVGHAHVAWSGTRLGVPEVQDFFVPGPLRGHGIGTRLAIGAEALVAARGHDRVSLGVSATNAAAQRLYERLGYVRADIPPERVVGRIRVRGGTIDVDDTLVYFVKRVDSESAHSS